MRKILLIIEYDGTEYAGWQAQSNSTGVQEVVEGALAEILGKQVRIHASGRTDAGVHAFGMAAHFETDSAHPLKAFREGVNRHLPRDVVIRKVSETTEGFHARFSAKGKWYRYTIYRGEVRSPLVSRTSWYRCGELDLDKMRCAAASFVGEHDFRMFRTSGCAAKTTVRQLTDVTLTLDGDFLYLDFYGTGFLKNMVRMMVGTLVEIGQGKRDVEDVKRLLAADSDLKSGPTAPPQGLCLREVLY